MYCHFFYHFDVSANKPSQPVPAKLEEAKQPPVRSDEHSDDDEGDRVGGQGDIQPVGHDYVEEVCGMSSSL